MSENPGLTRRALFGWLVSLGGAGLVLAIFAATQGALSNLPGLFSKRQRTGRAKAARLRRRQPWRNAPREASFLRTRKGVVHLQTSRLFSRQRRPVRGQVVKEPLQVAARCLKKSGATPTSYFAAREEGVIREHLALSLLSFQEGRITGNIEQALETLRPVFDDNRNRCNWRLYELYGRLLCLRYDDKQRQLAYDAARRELWPYPDATLPAIPGRPADQQPLAWLASLDSFTRWHQRTRSDAMRKRLVKRMEQARVFVEGQSSSGKDTASRGEDRSNRPSPSSHKRSARRTRRNLREHRQAAVRPSPWRRFSDAFSRAVTNGPRRPAVRDRYPRRSHWICPAPRRDTTCAVLKRSRSR